MNLQECFGNVQLRGQATLREGHNCFTIFSLAVALWQIDLKHKGEKKMKGKPEADIQATTLFRKHYFRFFSILLLARPSRNHVRAEI